MAIDDNTSYELTGAQVKDLANKIKAKAADNIFVGATSAAPGSKGLVPQPQAGDDAKFLSGDGTWKVAPNVVQTMGQSTSDVMSQVATSQMIFPSGSETSKENIAIGADAEAKYGSLAICFGSNRKGAYAETGGIAIGPGSNVWNQKCEATGVGSVAIGYGACHATGNRAIALGDGAYASGTSSIAIGMNATASANNVVSVGDGGTSWGPSYRRIINVDTPTADHDAATKEYVDTLVGDIETALAAINGN